MKFKKILLSLLICLSCFVQAKNITISRLTCEMQEGLVVVEGSPRLGWVMESPENGTRQSAYEIDIREAFTGEDVEVLNIGDSVRARRIIDGTDAGRHMVLNTLERLNYL